MIIIYSRRKRLPTPQHRCWQRYQPSHRKIWQDAAEIPTGTPSNFVQRHGSGRQLFEHLAEVEDAAQSRLETIVPALAKAAGATEALKAADPMKWVGIMNACKAQAEEIIFQ